MPELKISTGGQQGPGQQKEDSNGGNKAGSLSPGRPIKVNIVHVMKMFPSLKEGLLAIFLYFTLKIK